MAVSFRGVYPMLKNDVFCGHFVAIIAMATLFWGVPYRIHDTEIRHQRWHKSHNMIIGLCLVYPPPNPFFLNTIFIISAFGFFFFRIQTCLFFIPVWKHRSIGIPRAYGFLDVPGHYLNGSVSRLAPRSDAWLARKDGKISPEGVGWGPRGSTCKPLKGGTSFAIVKMLA